MLLAFFTLGCFSGKADFSANYLNAEGKLDALLVKLELIRDTFAKSEVEEKEVKLKREGEKPMTLRLRPLSEEEAKAIKKWSHSRTEAARLVQRATIIHLASEGQTVPQIAQAMGVGQKMVRLWLKRFAEQGLVGLQDTPRSGSPSTYGAEVKAQIIATAMTPPRELGLSFSSWTFDRLATYVQEVLGIGIKRTRIFEILQEEGLRWRKQETWFGELKRLV